LGAARYKFPQPEKMDVSTSPDGKLTIKRSFIIYMIAISMLALGFADFPLITMHISREQLVPSTDLPLLYAGAMIADAVAALFFGWLYDKKGIRVLMLSSAISATFTVFIFYLHSLPFALIGILFWGIGMGAQESILKAAVTTLVPRNSRSTGYGVFETAFGIFWFLGSWLMGALYDQSPIYLVLFSICAQVAAIPLFYFTWKQQNHEKLPTSHATT